MSMAWFRSYHGAPLDAKHVTIGKRTETPAGVSCAVWWALLDYASQNHDRGSVSGFDCEVVANFFGWPVETVKKVVSTMGDVGLITDGRISNWDKRQVRRERPADNSTERVRRFRERRDTNGNATKRPETPRVDKRRVDKRELQEEREDTEISTWLTPLRDAWESGGGIGSFNFGVAAKVYRPIVKRGVPVEELARRLRVYCQVMVNTGKTNFMNHPDFARRHQHFAGPLYENDTLTPLGKLVTQPPPEAA